MQPQPDDVLPVDFFDTTWFATVADSATPELFSTDYYSGIYGYKPDIVTLLPATHQVWSPSSTLDELDSPSLPIEHFLHVPSTFVCPVKGCGSSYIRKQDLKTHVHNIHGAELAATITEPRSSKVGKAYCCPIEACPCGYSRKNDLKRHLWRVHDMKHYEM